jgi:hypothetical protein
MHRSSAPTKAITEQSSASTAVYRLISQPERAVESVSSVRCLLVNEKSLEAEKKPV